MSLPSPGLHASRKHRASSVSSSRPIPAHGADLTGASERDTLRISFSTETADGPRDSLAAVLASTPSSHREPTRSFFHSSFRGNLAPIDSVQNARHVREDTAELASYALSDKASSIRSNSPSGRSAISQPQLDSYFQASDSDVLPETSTEDLRRHVIHEVSEPVSPDNGPAHHKSPSTSALANLLRNSPPEHSSETISDDELDEGSKHQVRGRRGSGRSKRTVSATEETPLLAQKSVESSPSPHPDYLRGEHDLESQLIQHPSFRAQLTGWASRRANQTKSMFVVATNPKRWDRKAILRHGIIEPAGYIPAVILGSLLNVLDALSYGMILFPLGQPIFEKLGPAGISMFYVSCIVSQLVYSCGGSIFKGGIGSEMIEVVPFFHKMAFTILEAVGEDKPDVVIATTITAYAASSIFTGLVFFLMGVCKFGYVVGFIPRHILVGCIGGVGFFLVVTGFEVTARLDGNLNFDGDTLSKMMQSDTILLWLLPFTLAVIYYILSKKITNKYFLATYILAIPALFYFWVFALDNLSIFEMRGKGYIFDGPEADEPWWYFYTLYDFNEVDWEAFALTFPAMFALTFFGVLHVPINVPALGFSVGEDNMDLNRELIAHGASNAISGFCGSIQNYLVYTNSVQFIKSGGDSRVAGVMLAFATFAIMLVGPSVIGFIPVMMVGCLIFILGFELLFEAVWDPIKKLKTPEYLTVIVIVLVMGIYDFVWGIGVGIGLAFASLVFQTSRVSAVRSSYSGEIAGSTVRRNPTQQKYLHEVGKQVHVTKLAGFLFFGTIVSVEARMRSLIEEETFNDRPIRYLIFDLWHVTGIDYSAAEAFTRLNRQFSKKGVSMVISGIEPESPISLSLRNVGLGEGPEGGNEVKVLPDLNSALESCENELLKMLYANREARSLRNMTSMVLEVPGVKSPVPYSLDTQFNSPRRSELHNIATKTLNETESNSHPKWQNFKEPLRLILQTFQGLTDKNEDFWFRAVPYFSRKEYSKNTVLYHRGQAANGFYLLETGILRADYKLPQGHYFESIVAGTTCGELPFFSQTDRTATVLAERDCVAWLMDRQNWEELREKDKDVAQALLEISLKMTSERMSAITSYVLTTAG